MSCPAALKVGLKEWAVVCGALASGRQMILLRKGGIYESAGEFEVEHREFLLFPTYLHQNTDMLKADVHDQYQPFDAEPAHVTISSAGVVTDIIELKKSRKQMDALDEEHIWTPPLIDMRFNYKPANPLYLLLVRAYRLPAPQTIANTPAYAGCKSWVPLDREIACAGATPAIDPVEYEARRQKILTKLS
jgi:hypothetical protein